MNGAPRRFVSARNAQPSAIWRPTAATTKAVGARAPPATNAPCGRRKIRPASRRVTKVLRAPLDLQVSPNAISRNENLMRNSFDCPRVLDTTISPTRVCLLVGFCHKEHTRASRATKENGERLLLLSTCTFPSKTWRSVFVSQRPALTLSCPAPAGFRERRGAPFRVRAKRQLTVHELTRIRIEFVQIREDSWTTRQGLSPPRPLPYGGLRPRPRKPTAPRTVGHERTLRATRNPAPPPVETRKRSAPASTFKMPSRQMCLDTRDCPRINTNFHEYAQNSCDL